MSRLSVKATDLVPSIKGGALRTIGSLDNVNADASTTMNPDRQALDLNMAVFKWTTNTTTSTCFRNQDGSTAIGVWSKTNLVIKASGGCLEANETFQLKVDVKRRVGDLEFFSYTQMVKKYIYFFTRNPFYFFEPLLHSFTSYILLHSNTLSCTSIFLTSS